MTWAPDLAEQHREAARYVDQILGGASRRLRDPLSRTSLSEPKQHGGQESRVDLPARPCRPRRPCIAVMQQYLLEGARSIRRCILKRNASRYLKQSARAFAGLLSNGSSAPFARRDW